MDAGERRVVREVVYGENNRIPQFTFDLTMFVFHDEKPVEPFLAHVGLDCAWVPPGSGNGKRVAVDIRGEDLNLRPAVPARCFFQKEHRYGVGFLARGAARRPNANDAGRVLALEQARNNDLGKRIERGSIPEKGCHRYEKVAEKSLNLGRIFAEELQILLKPLDLLHLHTARKPPQDGWALVFGKVVARSRPQIRKCRAKQFFIAIAGLNSIIMLVLHDGRKPLRELAQWQNVIRASSCHGGARHGRVFGLFRVLNEDQPASLLDRLHAHRAIRAGACQDHGKPVDKLARKRPEKVVYRRAGPSRFLELASIERTVRDD